MHSSEALVTRKKPFGVHLALLADRYSLAAIHWAMGIKD